MPTHINPLHVYTMKYTESITFNFPNVPILGNSLIYVWSMMGVGALPATEGGLGGPGLHYNNGLGSHDLDFGSLLTGDTSPATNTGGNGASTAIYWTQCVQATFNSVTIGGSVDNSGMGSVVTSYLTIYEVEGLIGQTPGVPTSTNFNPIFDWKPNHAAAQGIVTVADGSLVALGEHMVINPGIENCACPPPATCGANDQQAKFTLGANLATVIANCAIPDVDFFNVVDPCDPAYVSNDFIFAVCSNGAANALNLTDNIQGQWHIDYQIDGQIFGHVTDTVSTTGNIQVIKVTSPSGSPQVFTFRPSWESFFTLSDGQSHLSPALTPGFYSITEDAVSDWDTVITVSNGNLPSAINLGSGQTITVTFTNTVASPTCFADGIVPAGAIDGINTSFTLPNAPNPPGSLILESDTSLLAPGVGFTLSFVLSGARLSLAYPPKTSLVAWYRFVCGSQIPPLYKLNPDQAFDDNAFTSTPTAINSTYFTYGFVNAAKSAQNPLLGFHRKRFSEIQLNVNGSGQFTVTTFPNYILKKDLSYNPYAYVVPPIVLQTDPPDDLIRPLNSVGNRVYVMFQTNAVGASFDISKTILVGVIDGWATVNPNV